MVANPESVRRAPVVAAQYPRGPRNGHHNRPGRRGRGDPTTAPGLSDIAQRVIAEGRNLIIDLSDVSFLDASTVRALLDADVAAHSAGASSLSSSAGRRSQNVLSITGADRKLVTAATRGAAMALVATAA